MPTQGLGKVLAARLDEMAQSGRLKGRESLNRAVIAARDGRGPRYLIEGEGEKPFLRMNSNSYLGMTLRPEVIARRSRRRQTMARVPEQCASSAALGPRMLR